MTKTPPSPSGERTRLACYRQSGSDRWRPRHRGLFPPQSVAARRRNWRAGRCAPEQRKFNRNDETRVFKDWRDGQDAPVRWRAAPFSTRLRAAGQLLELKLLFSKKRRVVLISGAPLVFHLVARVVRQGINAPLSACFFLPAKACFGYADTNVLL